MKNGRRGKKIVGRGDGKEECKTERKIKRLSRKGNISEERERRNKR
jgi:hypothetical protein